MNIEHFKNIVSRLPSGRAWRGKIQRIILKVIADKIATITDELKAMTAIKEILLGFSFDKSVILNDDLYTLGSEFSMLGPQEELESGNITIWEFILDLEGIGTAEERLNAIIAALTNSGAISPNAVQDVLQDSGFDVYVHRNGGSDLLGPRVTLGANTNLNGLIGAGVQEVRLAGEADIIDPDIIDTELCVNFIDSAKDESKYRPNFTTDPRRWEFCFFIGGAAFLSRADVPAARKTAFRELILRSKPAGLWAVLLIDYI